MEFALVIEEKETTPQAKRTLSPSSLNSQIIKQIRSL